MKKRRFQRRLYANFDEFVFDIRYIKANSPIIRRAMRELIAPDFRERLMLVVTEVNGCRYCEYGHGLAALKVGVTQEQLDKLMSGLIPESTPQTEHVALLYARHWAERNAQPDPESVIKLVTTYGQEKADAIHILFRMIRVGNLLGNLGDYIIYRLTFGLVGLRKDEQRFAI